MALMEEMERSILVEGKGFVSVTGGGGKTSFMISFARHLAGKGLSVLMTTSTRIAHPSRVDYGASHFFSSSHEALHYHPGKGDVVLYGEKGGVDGKLVSGRESTVSLLSSRYDVTVVEADGSRGLPLKIHSMRDPVIFSSTTAVVSVMGLWGIGRKVNEAVFGDEGDGTVDMEYLALYFSNPEGPGKGMDGSTRNVFLFNGADFVPHSVISSVMGIPLPHEGKGYAGSIMEDRLYGTF